MPFIPALLNRVPYGKFNRARPKGCGILAYFRKNAKQSNGLDFHEELDNPLLNDQLMLS
jgi:hypothetical protein